MTVSMWFPFSHSECMNMRYRQDKGGEMRRNDSKLEKLPDNGTTFHFLMLQFCFID